jgi:hypothetical protein
VNLLLALKKIFWIFTKFAYLQIMRILYFVVLYIAIARLATILSVVRIEIYNCRIKSGMCKGLLNFHSLFLKFWFFPQLQSILILQNKGLNPIYPVAYICCRIESTTILHKPLLIVTFTKHVATCVCYQRACFSEEFFSHSPITKYCFKPSLECKYMMESS